jgi:membrane protease YdiL (CAAX protease family)
MSRPSPKLESRPALIAEDHSKSLVVSRPLLVYFVLSYAFFWLFLILYAITAYGLLGLQPDSQPPWLMPLVQIIGSWMPAAAALIVTGLLAGRQGIVNLFAKFIRFRMAARWVFAALIPFGLALLSAGIYRLAGGSFSPAANLSLGFWLELTVVNLLSGPTGEEVGWRGFALPHLLEKYSPLRAGLVLGLLWGFWHLPLWLTSGFSSVTLLLYCLFFLVAITSLSILMTWIFCRTFHSLVPMTLAHFSFNAGFLLVGLLIPALPFFIIMSALLCSVTVIVWRSSPVSANPVINP